MERKSAGSMHLLVYSLGLLFVFECASSCPEVCRCSVTPLGKKKADCSSEGIFAIPTTLQHDINILDLSSNPIAHLSNDIFKDRNFLQLEEIHLSGHSVNEIEVYAFRGLSNLQIVDLSKSRLKALDKDLFKENKKLSTINLRHNPFIQLPENRPFINSLSLKTLDLGQCNLKSIPESTFSLMRNVERLILDNNEIQNVSAITFSELPNLTYLDLSGNKISNIAPNLIHSNTKLKTLILNKNPLNLAQGIRFSTFSLFYPPDLSLRSGAFLTSDSLENLEVSDSIRQMIPGDFLCRMPNLKRINLSHSFLFRIQEVHFTCLTKIEEVDLSIANVFSLEAEIFETNYLLKKLNLSANIWGSIISVSDSSIKLHSSSLTYLDVRSNSNYKFTGFEFADVPNVTHLIIKSNPLLRLNEMLLSFLKDLEHLDASSTSLILIDLHAFSENKKLKYLSLRDNMLTRLSYMDQILNIPSLETLDMSYCELTNLTHDAFANLPRLQTLFLNGNSFSYLPENIFLPVPFLQHLDLSNCQMALFHPKMLANNTELVDLSLRGNPLHGIAHGDQFDKNSKLETLDLRECDLYRIQSNVFSNLVGLKTLYLDGNIMKSLDIETFSSLSNLTKLGLSGNHWRCDCKLKSLLVWTMLHDIKFSETVFCQEPEEMIGWTWYQLITLPCDGNANDFKECSCSCNGGRKRNRTTNDTVAYSASDCPCSNSINGINQGKLNDASNPYNSSVVAISVVCSILLIVCIGLMVYFMFKMKRRVSNAAQLTERDDRTISVVNLLNTEQ